MNINLKFELDGRKFSIPVEISEEEIGKLNAYVEAEAEKNGWEKPEDGHIYYYEDALCRVQSIRMNTSSAAQLNILYEKANCYSSEKLAEDLARGDALIRQLRRLAAEQRSKPVDFKVGGYTITYNYQDNCLECGITGPWAAVGDILFETEEQAQYAIATYADELIWYFTEMKDKF